MKKMLLRLILMIIGVAGGGGAAYFLGGQKAEETASEACVPAEGAAPIEAAEMPSVQEASTDKEYAKLNNQFVVPVVSEGKVSALIVMSLSVEVTTGSKETVFAFEPKLRDRFLQVMFDHANLGGFDGAFTSGPNLRQLREALLSAAKATLNDVITDVLILDIVRQDV